MQKAKLTFYPTQREKLHWERKRCSFDSIERIYER